MTTENEKPCIVRRDEFLYELFVVSKEITLELCVKYAPVVKANPFDAVHSAEPLLRWRWL